MDRPRIVVTSEKFDRIFSIDDWFNFEKLPQNEVYAKMLNFVVDAEGQPVEIEEARKIFKKIPKAEWINCIADFIRAVDSTFVNPTNGGS